MAVYAVIAWLVLQIGEVTLEPLGFPPWSMRALIVVAIVGFPVVFFLAWIIRIEPGGMIFDVPLWKGSSGERGERKTDMVVVAAVGALLVIGAYTIGTHVFQQASGGPDLSTRAAAPNSIAVLAFENYSTEADNKFFSSGLAEEILNRLSGLTELNVAARSSSFRFSGEKYDVRDVAKTLSVRNVLEGSVMIDGSRLRVSVQLVDGENGFNVWNKTYDRKLDQIFTIQQEIASSVVNELQIALSVESKQELKRQPTDDLDAYVFYLQGIERLRSPQDQDVLRAAAELFTRATELDATFFRAYAGLCEAHLGIYAMNDNPAAFDAADAACAEAARLDAGSSSEIHIARGRLYRNRGWAERAEQELLEAIDIAPGAVDAYIELGHVYLADDREAEAEAVLLRAVDLKRNYWRAHIALGDLYYRNERYREAVERYTVATQLAPDSAAVYSALGAAYWMLGDTDQASIAYDRSLQLKPTRTGYTNMGLRYYYAGEFSLAVNMQLKALELAPDDHRLWGRLAESYRFVDGFEAQSRQAYARAVELAEQALEINQSDWRAQGLLGLYYAHLSQPDKAARHIEKAVVSSQGNSEALYYQALVRLEFGDTRGALDALEEAVSRDEQYRQFLVSDPDLRVIADNERFRRLLLSPQ